MGFGFGNAIASVRDPHIRACLERLGRSHVTDNLTLSTLVRNNVSTSDITAGAGLTGGGALNSETSVTLNVGAGAGITVNADSISISSSYLGANPTATIGLTAVNGTATTYMRSDAAPALGVGIVPTWTGIHTFSAQDVHNAGVSLGTSGALVSNVATAGVAYDLADAAGAGVRLSGTEFAIRRAADSRTMMEVTWDGRFGFGYTSQALGIIAQAQHILSFLQSDADSPAGAPHTVGILAQMNHANASQTASKLIGMAGSVVVNTATGLTAVPVSGMLGAVACSADSSFAGKILVCFNGNASQLATVATTEITTKDISFAKSAHIKGGWDHMTVLWCPNFSSASATGYPTNKPAITSSIRATIQDWGGGSAAGSAANEMWAIYGENINGAVATFPAHTGYIRMTYPRRTGGTTPAVHATHAWMEPWPNTATIRGGGLVGDVYFDDGTNFSAGLYQGVVAGAYQKLVSVVTPGRVTAQTAAVATVAAFTVGASDASFEVSMNVLVTTSTTHTFTCECAYTDEGNTARTLTLQFSSLAGAFVTAIANAAGAVPYDGVPLHIRCKSATTITLRTQAAGTYTTVTFNAEGIIKQTS